MYIFLWPTGEAFFYLKRGRIRRRRGKTLRFRGPRPTPPSPPPFGQGGRDKSIPLRLPEVFCVNVCDVIQQQRALVHVYIQHVLELNRNPVLYQVP